MKMQNQPYSPNPKTSKISIFDYLTLNAEDDCCNLLVKKYNYRKPKTHQECVSMLKSIYRKDEDQARLDLASIHPDLELMEEYFKKSGSLDACGCPFGADGELNCEGCGKKGSCGFDGIKSTNKELAAELEKRRHEVHNPEKIEKTVEHLPADGQKTTDDYVKALIPTIAILFTFTIITYLITRKS